MSLKEPPLFEFLNRRDPSDFESFMENAVEGADFVRWNDYAYPDHFGDAEAEYWALRNSCALTELSCYRMLRVKGPRSSQLLQYLFPLEMANTVSLTVEYGLLCNEDGKLMDDLDIYKLDEEDYLVSASDIDHGDYFRSTRDQLQLSDVSIEREVDWRGISIQGPHSAILVNAMDFPGVEQLPPCHLTPFDLGGRQLFIAREGFTGDLGYECWMHLDQLDDFLGRLRAARLSTGIEAPGYGLSVLEATRLEGGRVIAGWDYQSVLDEGPGYQRSPLELNMEREMDFHHGEFVGRDALLLEQAEGSQHKMRSFELLGTDRPDMGTPIYSGPTDHPELIGHISCANWSWGLDRMIGNASIIARHSDNQLGWIHINDERRQLRLRRPPLMDLDRHRQVPASLDKR